MTSARRLLSALLVWSVVGAAHAAGPTASVRLEVRAAPECTSQADLTARILARLRRARFGDDTAALGVRARFTALPSGNVVAELTLTKPGAKPSSRRLVARSCAQAAEAAALIVAVTLDPTSLSEAPTTVEEPPAKGEGASEPSPRSSVEARANGSGQATSEGSPQTPPKPIRASKGPQPSSEAPRSDPPLIPLEPDENRAEPASPTWAGSPRFGAHASAQVLAGVAPELMPSIAVYAIAGLDREALWSPAVMLGATHGFSASGKEAGGTADFWLDAASLDACALRIPFRALEARACASALVGRLSANGTDTGNAAGIVRRPFAAAGAAAILTFRVDRMIELTARAAGGANLVRDSFEFAPFVFHTVPRMTFAASVGIGIRSR